MENVYPDWVSRMNEMAREKTPFLAVVAFDREIGHVYSMDECQENDIFFDVNHQFHPIDIHTPLVQHQLQFDPPEFESYQRQFDLVIDEIDNGNTYLLNLCTASRLASDLNLNFIYQQARAKFKLYFKGQFVVFSPETFVSIRDGVLSTYPMKGTIDASISNAEHVLRNDEKEMAEHYTIVDLLRNDIGMVCNHVSVKRFAYIDKIQTSKGAILQMSSEIEGEIADEYTSAPGELFYKILPAGSISGAPKQKSLEIIQELELFPRNYYTGVMIYFDGLSFESGVLIRYIENNEEGLWYKSGGGITFQSDVKKEYEEIIKKIYLPIF